MPDVTVVPWMSVSPRQGVRDDEHAEMAKKVSTASDTCDSHRNCVMIMLSGLFSKGVGDKYQSHVEVENIL
jgi:hypothetical protein